MKLVLINGSGMTLAECRVEKRETPSDRLLALLLNKTWILESGDTVAVVEEERK